MEYAVVKMYSQSSSEHADEIIYNGSLEGCANAMRRLIDDLTTSFETEDWEELDEDVENGCCRIGTMTIAIIKANGVPWYCEECGELCRPHGTTKFAWDIKNSKCTQVLRRTPYIACVCAKCADSEA